MHLNNAAPSAPWPGAFSEEQPVLPARALPLAHVRLGVEATSLEAVFAAVAQVVCGPQRPTVEQVVQRLARRHLRSSPALGQGLALPHAAVPVIRMPMAVYLRLRAPVHLLPGDPEGVTDCLALLVPTPGFLADHELLIRVSGFLRQPGSARALQACVDAESVRRLLTGLG